jgi:hypothetical protein
LSRGKRRPDELSKRIREGIELNYKNIERDGEGLDLIFYDFQNTTNINQKPCKRI